MIAKAPKESRARSQERIDDAVARRNRTLDYPQLAGMAGGHIVIDDVAPLILHPEETRLPEFRRVVQQVFKDSRVHDSSKVEAYSSGPIARDRDLVRSLPCFGEIAVTAAGGSGCAGDIPFKQCCARLGKSTICGCKYIMRAGIRFTRTQCPEQNASGW